MHVVPDDVFGSAADLRVESNVPLSADRVLVVDVELLVFEVEYVHGILLILVGLGFLLAELEQFGLEGLAVAPGSILPPTS